MSTKEPLLLRLVRALFGRKPSATRRPAASYPGDHRGPFTISYDPHHDALADPGEVVWTWVPYEEDFSRGKDRPVLIVGREQRWLLGVPLSSKDHRRDAAREARWGRYWVEIGSGAWDRSGRPSAVRVNRIIRVRPDDVRRIGARLDKPRFDQVAAGIRRCAKS